MISFDPFWHDRRLSSSSNLAPTFSRLGIAFGRRRVRSPLGVKLRFVFTSLQTDSGSNARYRINLVVIGLPPAHSGVEPPHSNAIHFPLTSAVPWYRFTSRKGLNAVALRISLVAAEKR